MFGNRLRISLKGLSGFRVTPGLLVMAHPHPVTVCQSFEFSMYFLLLSKILVAYFYGAKLGGVWRNIPPGFSLLPPIIYGNDFFIF